MYIVKCKRSIMYVYVVWYEKLDFRVRVYEL